MARRLGLNALSHLEQTTGRIRPDELGVDRRGPMKAPWHEKREFTFDNAELRQALEEAQRELPQKRVVFLPADRGIYVDGIQVFALPVGSFSIDFMEGGGKFITCQRSEIALPAGYMRLRAHGILVLHEALIHIAYQHMKQSVHKEPLATEILLSLQALRERIARDPDLRTAGVILDGNGCLWEVSRKRKKLVAHLDLAADRKFTRALHHPLIEHTTLVAKKLYASDIFARCRAQFEVIVRELARLTTN